MKPQMSDKDFFDSIIRANYDDESKKAFVKNYISSSHPNVRKEVPLYILYIGAQQADVGVHERSFDEQIKKSRSVCRIFQLNQITGKMQLIKVVNKRPHNPIMNIEDIRREINARQNVRSH